MIRLRGVRTHNLKNLDLDIPRSKLVVITGLSGSGKSSLAFDTLYAEGQRRYVESLSPYARQFLQLMERPDADLIEGLSPAIAIEQKSSSHNPRSTVGTVTEILDYLRLLFARVGVPHCPTHPHQRLESQSVSQMVDALLEGPEGERISLLAPVAVHQKGEHRELLDGLRAQGFVRVRVRSGTAAPQDMSLDHLVALQKSQHHSIDVVVDRLKRRPNLQQRLAESLEMALRLGQDQALALIQSDDDRVEERSLSLRFACPECGFSLRDLEPNLFSFNSPAGACPQCDGLGEESRFDPDRVVEFPHLSLANGAIAGWDARNSFAFAMIESLAAHGGFSVHTPFEDLSPQHQALLLHGSGDEKIAFTYPSEQGKTVTRKHVFEGVIPNLNRRFAETDSAAVREELGRYRRLSACSGCEGSRLKPEARHVRVGPAEASISLPELLAMPLTQAAETLASLPLTGMRKAIGERLLHETQSRLRFLIDVGLSYLRLDRTASSLSGGESQRIRLASQIGAGLTGVMYVLDEPSIGLHQRDNDRLLKTLAHLRDLGNSVLVVEHDEDAIRAADHIIDMGPGAGRQGGQVIAQGSLQDVLRSPQSLTGQYLSGSRAIPIPNPRRAPDERWLVLKGARANNLKQLTVRIPVGLLVCVTGVSGSGKSTLINDTLVAHAQARLNGSHRQAAEHDGLDGLEHFDRIINVDQSPIGRTPRSNPATYTGMLTTIRELFAESPMARERGYDAGRFSFNVKGGRCEACQGDGMVRVEMHFLPDVYVPCDLCKGLRFNRETLDVRWRGKTIAEVLAMTVDEAAEFFLAIPPLARRLHLLQEVGLGYVQLGQSATTLSGGEAQRVKLACELSKRETGKTLYVLDEPTTGLHFYDTEMLLHVLMRLRDSGNTVLIIEHNLDVIKTADWILDMGPEGGDGGGQLIAQGPPEDIVRVPESHTGRYLGPLLRPSTAKGSPKA